MSLSELVLETHSRFIYLLTGILVDRVGLAPVLGDLIVDHGDDVRSDGGLVDGGESARGGRLLLFTVHGHHRSGGG